MPSYFITYKKKISIGNHPPRFVTGNDIIHEHPILFALKNCDGPGKLVILFWSSVELEDIANNDDKLSETLENNTKHYFFLHEKSNPL